MKVLILASYDRSLLNFRRELLKRMVERGCDVTASAPQEAPFVERDLRSIGVAFRPIALQRASLNLLADRHYYVSVRRLCGELQPEIVLAYTAKPIIYGLRAAHAACGCRKYALVTGLGTAFNTPGIKGYVMKRVAISLYRRSANVCDVVFAQNSDIRDTFLKCGVVASHRIVTVAGSGVDSTLFQPSPFTAGDGCFVFVGRLLHDKGIREFVAAATALRSRGGRARFIAVGEIDENPTSVSKLELAEWRQDGTVEFVGYAEDVRPYLAQCTALVLPSYHEGMPRTVLEAMASGRAVITTDAVGCRETVFGAPAATKLASFRVGVNGILVKPKDSVGLAAAMEHLATNAYVAAAMGEAGRKLAITRFDVNVVNAAMLAAMRLGDS